ncbi:hypothetical protein SKAU_G00393360 [Synaphobranchus kaupii]|uniref:Uncharacterized protein n=1 Tax=Synaphobranchus kaupii TaxID=118154 RepID=A0A9Q1EBX1_SYNKA|nr:hypothetical protein SKAU_G00393360 [Synaphobranchus kaupii]
MPDPFKKSPPVMLCLWRKTARPCAVRHARHVPSPSRPVGQIAVLNGRTSDPSGAYGPLWKAALVRLCL